jgi:hypothetical protein
MKRLIFLKREYLDTKKDKIKKADEPKLLAALSLKAVKAFKDQAKSLIDKRTIKIIKDYLPEPQVLIQFEDKLVEDIYHLMRGLDIVEVIDFVIPVEDE